MANKASKRLADSKLQAAYTKYYSSIYKFCLSRLKDDSSYVEDCVQEAYVVLYNRLLSGEEIEYTQAFLYKTASNLIKKHFAQLRKEQNNISLEDIKELQDFSVDIDDRLSFEEYSRMISDALNDTDSEIFSMRYIEELKIEDIAERLGLTIPNVTTRLSRMRGRIKQLLENSSE